MAPSLTFTLVIVFIFQSYNMSIMSKADLAQLVERVAFNHVVVGSSPTVGGEAFLLQWKSFAGLRKLLFLAMSAFRKFLWLNHVCIDRVASVEKKDCTSKGQMLDKLNRNESST